MYMALASGSQIGFFIFTAIVIKFVIAYVFFVCLFLELVAYLIQVTLILIYI